MPTYPVAEFFRPRTHRSSNISPRRSRDDDDPACFRYRRPALCRHPFRRSRHGRDAIRCHVPDTQELLARPAGTTIPGFAPGRPPLSDEVDEDSLDLDDDDDDDDEDDDEEEDEDEDGEEDEDEDEEGEEDDDEEDEDEEEEDDDGGRRDEEEEEEERRRKVMLPPVGNNDIDFGPGGDLVRPAPDRPEHGRRRAGPRCDSVAAGRLAGRPAVLPGNTAELLIAHVIDPARNGETPSPSSTRAPS